MHKCEKLKILNQYGHMTNDKIFEVYYSQSFGATLYSLLRVEQF